MQATFKRYSADSGSVADLVVFALTLPIILSIAYFGFDTIRVPLAQRAIKNALQQAANNLMKQPIPAPFVEDSLPTGSDLCSDQAGDNLPLCARDLTGKAKNSPGASAAFASVLNQKAAQEAAQYLAGFSARILGLQLADSSGAAGIVSRFIMLPLDPGNSCNSATPPEEQNLPSPGAYYPNLAAYAGVFNQYVSQGLTTPLNQSTCGISQSLSSSPIAASTIDGAPSAAAQSKVWLIGVMYARLRSSIGSFGLRSNRSDHIVADFIAIPLDNQGGFIN